MDKNQSLWLRNEVARCLLCHDAPCSGACPGRLDPARTIRSARFENVRPCLGGGNCADCAAPCEQACPHSDYPVRIRRLMSLVHEAASAMPEGRADISMDFCGVRCVNPFFLGSSVIASDYEMCARAFEAGWGGLVFKTVAMMSFQEVSPRFDSIAKEATPFIGFRNLEQLYDKPFRNAFDDMGRLKKNFPDRVVVASIMGQNISEWTELARMASDSGADIIECNFSCPHMEEGGLGAAIGSMPEAVEKCTVAAVRGAAVPVLAKLTPNVTDMVAPAIAAINAGAAGLAAINTIRSLTGILDDARLIAGKTAISGYSGKAVKPIALRFVAELKSEPTLRNVPLSGIGGIETWRDAAEFFALGCENVQAATAVMQYGYRVVEDMADGLGRFLSEKGYDSLRAFTGSRLDVQVGTDSLNRESVVYPVVDRERCVRCGRCHISCRDGGHQAISLRDDRAPAIDGKRCIGCLLCSLICPVGAIGASRRVAATSGGKS